MLKLIEFRHNHHPSGVKMLENLIRRGIPVIVTSHKAGLSGLMIPWSPTNRQ
jgi:hypothetical protein